MWPALLPPWADQTRPTDATDRDRGTDRWTGIDEWTERQTNRWIDRNNFELYHKFMHHIHLMLLSLYYGYA